MHSNAKRILQLHFRRFIHFYFSSPIDLQDTVKILPTTVSKRNSKFSFGSPCIFLKVNFLLLFSNQRTYKFEAVLCYDRAINPDGYASQEKDE